MAGEKLPVNTSNAGNGTGKVLVAGISCKSWTGKKPVGATKVQAIDVNTIIYNFLVHMHACIKNNNQVVCKTFFQADTFTVSIVTNDL